MYEQGSYLQKRLGNPVIPLEPAKAGDKTSGKATLNGYKFSEANLLSEPALRRLDDIRCNMGLRLDGLFVADCDSREAADFVEQNFGPTEWIQETGGGGLHYVYETVEEMRNRTNYLRLKLDFKTGKRAYIVVADSISYTGKQYRWLSRGKMGVFDPACLPEEPKIEIPPRDESIDEFVAVIMTKAYINEIPGAVSGQGGHNATFRVACKIRDRLAGLLSPEECLPIMQEYNERCKPKWSTKELLHKLYSAWRAVL